MLCWTDLSGGLGLKEPLDLGLSLDLLRIGVIFEDFVYPLRVERYIDEDARLIGSGTAPAMDADSHNHPDFPILTYQRATVVSLQTAKTKQKNIDQTFLSFIALESCVIAVYTHQNVQWKQNAPSTILETNKKKT